MAESEQIAEERIEQALDSQTEALDLSGLGLTILPETIGQLKKLHVLRAVKNNLIVLPKSLLQLKELQGLYIWANRLTELPATIGELDQLEELDVSKNRLWARCRNPSDGSGDSGVCTPRAMSCASCRIPS